MKQKDNYRELDDYIRSMSNMADPLSGDTSKICPVVGEANRVWEAFHADTIVNYQEDLRNAKSEPGQVNLPAVRMLYAETLEKARSLLIHELGQRGYRFDDRHYADENEKRRTNELPYMIADNVQSRMERFQKFYGAAAKPAWVDYTFLHQTVDGRKEEVQRTRNLTDNYRKEIMDLATSPLVTHIDNVYGAYYPVSVNRVNIDFEVVKASSEQEAVNILEDSMGGRGYLSKGPANIHAFAIGYDREQDMHIRRIAVEAPSDTFVLNIASHYLSNAIVAARDEDEAILLAKHHFGVQTDESITHEFEKPVRIQVNPERLLHREIIPSLRKVNEQAVDGIHLIEYSDLDDCDRITDVCIVSTADGKTSIRCKVDDRQQLSKQVGKLDRLFMAAGRVTKEELALKYFRDELDQGRANDRGQEQQQGKGMHR